MVGVNHNRSASFIGFYWVNSSVIYSAIHTVIYTSIALFRVTQELIIQAYSIFCIPPQVAHALLEFTGI